MTSNCECCYCPEDAIEYGHIKCLNFWIVIYGLHKDLYYKSILCNNDLKMVKYLRENLNCPWDEDTCASAAIAGRYDFLEYFHKKSLDNTIQWNEKTCEAAAEYGQLLCLIYAHENGCPWNEKTCKLAANNIHCRCIKRDKYYISEDCECLEYIIDDDCYDCLKYAMKNGCPYNINDSPVIKKLAEELKLNNYVVDENLNDVDETVPILAEKYKKDLIKNNCIIS